MSVVVQASPARDPEIQRLRALYELVAALTKAGVLAEIYDVALTSLLETTAADRAAILLFDDDGVMQFQASRGLSPEYQAAVTGHSPWPRGTRDARPVVVKDALRDEGFARYRDVLLREKIRGLAFLPLVSEGGVFGKLMLYYAEPHECAGGELEIAEAIGSHVALATEHKRVELARAHSEQRLQAILDNSTTLIFVKDSRGRYQLVNRRYRELFHVTEEQVLGKTDYDLFPRETADRFLENDRAVLASGRPHAVEEAVLQDDGLHAYISMKFPIREPDGSTSVCGIATDVTDRKQLDLESQRLAAIVESSDDAIISKDLNGIITSWNGGAQRIFGYTAEEVVGRPVSILAPPDRLDEMPQILTKIRAGQRVEHYETSRCTKDGRVIDVALTVSPIHDSEGRIVGASKIARDITDRRSAEEERAVLLAREQEARRTAELLNRVGPRLLAQLELGKLVQEATDIAIALVGAEFGAFSQNVIDDTGESYLLYSHSGAGREAFARFLAPRNAELLGPTFRGEAVVRSNDLTQDPRYRENAPAGDVLTSGLPVRSYLAIPVVTRSGEVLGALFFGHSAAGRFTEHHEAIATGIAAQAAIGMDNARLFEQAQWVQKELQRSNEELRRANRDLEVFAYSASHDLQEPLRTIAISAEIIDRNSGRLLPAEDAMFLASIRTGAKRMSALIQDLLAYTKATKYEEGSPPSVDSARVLAGVLEDLRVALDEAGASVVIGEMPTAAIHPTRLAHLFQNLISNAIKYRGKEAPRVQVAGYERDGWCVFSIRDNGIGIEPQFAEQIFGLFQRLHGREEYPGSGIGLSICQRIVEQYGGRIWLEQSAPGGGSTFCFSIPARPR
ncbi:MAG TPA: PAS domain S-box protein [Bryobacteraceae bacterium]|nr:PAS domain S-box protein [Bryobacteraceae bacterium]